MPASLTSSQIKDTYAQLLHISDGPTASEKVVYGGAGVATALNLSTTSLSVSNVRLSSSGIAPITGTFTMSGVNITSGQITGITDLAIADGGTGASNASDARTNLGLGTMATQTASSVAITGGTITNVNIPFGNISSRAYGSFSDITDQTGSISAATAVKFGTNEITGAGISITNNGSGNPTRITFDAAGTYMVAPNLQFANSDTSDHTVIIWLSKDGTNIIRSATKISVPKTTDGGTTFFQILFYDTVTAGQYIEVYWLPSNTAVTIDHTAAAAGPPAVPAIPSAIVVAERIA